MYIGDVKNHASKQSAPEIIALSVVVGVLVLAILIATIIVWLCIRRRRNNQGYNNLNN